MRKSLLFAIGVMLIAGLCCSAIDVAAETAKLEMKLVDTSVTPSSTGPPADYLFRMTQGQSFFMQVGAAARSGVPGSAQFSDVIKKEPKYNSESPFKGVAKLGSGSYGFAFDSSGDEVETVGSIKPAENVTVYDLLYFDVNGNGDLTDDKAIKAETARALSPMYVHCSFPVTQMKVQCEDAEIDYAFTMAVYTNVTSYTRGETKVKYSYANASLNAAAYRVGELTIGDEKQKVVLVDFNSNGRYDDIASVMMRGTTAYPQSGDVLFLNPPTEGVTGSPYDPARPGRHELMKLLSVDGAYYDVATSPCGGEITFEPSDITLGYIQNTTPNFRADVYSDLGRLSIEGDENGKAVAPEGEWKLMSYSLQGKEEVEDGAARVWSVSARGGGDSIKVVGGETSEVSFGAPFKAKVSARPAPDGKSVSLSMSLLGSGGESCSSLSVNGARPSAPEFVITKEDGSEVQKGSFEYG